MSDAIAQKACLGGVWALFFFSLPVIKPCELHLELWCHSLAHFKVLDSEGRVSGQGCGKDQGAVAVDVLPGYALHFFCHGAVNGAESTLLWGLGEVKRGRQTESQWKSLDAWSKTEPSQSRPLLPTWKKKKCDAFLEAVGSSFQEIHFKKKKAKSDRLLRCLVIVCCSKNKRCLCLSTTLSFSLTYINNGWICKTLLSK